MPSKHNIRRSSSRTLALEPRLLFDGAAMVAAQDVHEAQQKTSTTDSERSQSAEHSGTDSGKDQPTFENHGSAPPQAVALIDARLPNQVELAQQLQAQGVQVHLVQAGESGLAAIGNALSSAQNVSSLQIYSHSDHDSQQLGSDTISTSSLQAKASTDTNWQYYLNDAAHLDVHPESKQDNPAEHKAALTELPASPSSEIVFVSDNVENWQELVSALPASTKVVVLDSTRDGVEQMAAALAGTSNISAIHIISHGSAAELNLGTAKLNAQSMQGAYLDELSVIGQSLSADGDILIYGCDFAQGDAGLQAAMIFGGITGADIAASINPTGAASLGGDWDLELHAGTVETREILTAAMAAGWVDLLAQPVNTMPDPVAPATGSWTVGENNQVALTGLQVTDGTTTTVLTITLSVPPGQGVLSNIDGSGTFSSVQVTGSSTSTMTFRGTAAALNAYFSTNANGRPNFTPAIHLNGDVQLTMSTTDGTLSDTDTRLITVTPRSTAPTGTDSLVAISNGGSYTFSVASLGFNDSDDGAAANNFQSIIVTTLPAAADGTLTLNNVAVTLNQVIQVSDLPNLRFTTAAGANDRLVVGIGC